MKSMRISLLLTLVLSAALLSWARAADNVSYTATGAPSTATDANGALDVWQQFNSGGGFKDTFLGDSSQNGGTGGGTAGSSGAGAGTSAWALYAGGASDAQVTIQHFFDGGALTIGQTVSIDFDNGYVGSNDGDTSEVGLRLFGTGFNFVLAFNFIEGHPGGDYTYFDDAVSFGDTGFAYTDNGFRFSYTQTSATTYSASLTQGSTVVGSWTGMTDVAPAIIEIYDLNGQGASNPNANGSSDLFVNNLEVVPEPGTWVAAALSAAGCAVWGLRRRRS